MAFYCCRQRRFLIFSLWTLLLNLNITTVLLMSTVLMDSLQFQRTKTMVEFGVYKDGESDHKWRIRSAPGHGDMTLTRFWVWLQFLVSDLGLDASCVTDSPEDSDAWCVGYTGYCCKIYLRLTLQLPPSRPGPNLWRMSKLFWDKLFKSFLVGPHYSPPLPRHPDPGAGG